MAQLADATLNSCVDVFSATCPLGLIPTVRRFDTLSIDTMPIYLLYKHDGSLLPERVTFLCRPFDIQVHIPDIQNEILHTAALKVRDWMHYRLRCGRILGL